MDDGLPTACHRLFAHYREPERLPDAAPDFVINRLLEEGDGPDLRWLTSRFPESALVSWVEARGARQLSKRSRSFWEILLGHTARPAATEPRELWPH